jgi:FAD-linked oxidoreductase
MTRWRNWARTESANPVREEMPAGTEQVAHAVTRAGRDGLTVRMVGAGHSFTGAAVAPGVLLRPDLLTRVRSADPGSGLVTVESGIGLTRLCAELSARGLALTNMGDIRVQTLAGALQTGTHGTGRDSGTFASQVVGLELVLADGSVATVSRDRDPDLFDAARVGLGAYGILTAVTMQTEPAFLLRAHEEPRRLDDVLEHLDEWARTHDHVEFYWFPYTDRCLLKRNDRVAGPAAPLSPLRGWVDDELLSNSVFGAVNRLGRAAPRLVGPINALSSRALSAREYVDASWRVFTSPRRVRFVEQEYAIPRAELTGAMRRLTALVDRARSWAVSFPVEVRMLPGDDAWLSTAYQRDTAYIAVHCFERTPYAAYFAAVEELLLEHGGRPHWGKLHTRTSQDLATAYPRWADAARVRDRVDPERRFANPYVTRVLGP